MAAPRERRWLLPTLVAVAVAVLAFVIVAALVTGQPLL
jgi:hypothetical protein